jgi:hypothetical protein
MRRDFVFFVSGLPDDLLIRDIDYFLAPMRDDIRETVRKFTLEDIQYWYRKTQGIFLFAVFRNDFSEERPAFQDAYQRLSGILDGYSFLSEGTAPEVWPIVQIRTGDQLNTEIKLFTDLAWGRLNSKDGRAEELWKKRTSELMQRFLKFFEVVANGKPKIQSELVNQLGFSAKMYRHGQVASAFGINFLCKFTALEGLVCGSARNNKEQLLKERLSALFKHEPKIIDVVDKLWRMRCEASHQGKAFSDNFIPAINSVEMLMLGTIIFALNYVETVTTIDELWKKVNCYNLPPEAIQERPPEILQFAVTLMQMPIGTWNNIGKLIDHCFENLS